jgi:endonuclease/exonuclease/phosphatase family metal-dependent hydrolase
MVVAVVTVVADCSFRVLTVNAWNFVDGPNWFLRRTLLRALVRELRPDCVALEELRVMPATGGGEQSMAADIAADMRAEQLGEWAFFGATPLDDGGSGAREGVGIACRWPVSSVVAPLRTALFPAAPGCWDPLRRGALGVLVSVRRPPSPSGCHDVAMFVTHWSYAPCNHMANAQATLAFVAESLAAWSSSSSPSLPSVVLMGDFNIYVETSDAMRFLANQSIRVSTGTATTTIMLKDSFRTLHPDANKTPGFTFSPLEAKGGLHNRCDRVFHSDGTGMIRPRRAVVVCHPSSGVVTRATIHEHEDEQYPSDHCAVMVTFDVPCDSPCPVPSPSSSAASLLLDERGSASSLATTPPAAHVIVAVLHDRRVMAAVEVTVALLICVVLWRRLWRRRS